MLEGVIWLRRYIIQYTYIWLDSVMSYVANVITVRVGLFMQMSVWCRALDCHTDYIYRLLCNRDELHPVHVQHMIHSTSSSALFNYLTTYVPPL